MSAIKIVKCPHCGYTLKASRFVSSSGCPIKKCPSCNGEYIDRNCYEPALEPFKEDTIITEIGLSLFASAIFSFLPFVIFAFVTDLDFAKTGRYTAIAFLVIFVICLIRMILNRAISSKQRRIAWEESDKRLQDMNYAVKLKYYGFNVPKKYLP